MGIAKLKLYHYPASRSARVRWLLHELGVPFEEEVVPLYDGVQYQADFLAKNPSHAVPTLLITWTNGQEKYMVESGAIVTFLADAYAEAQLAPPPDDRLARADYLQMIAFGCASLDMMLWQIRIHEHILPVAQRDAATVARYRHKFTQEAEAQLQQRLSATPYICGETFSAADCIIGHNILWANTYALCTHDVFRAYLERLLQRTAFQLAFSDAHQFNVEPPERASIVDMFTG